jgi:hypothetical protein
MNVIRFFKVRACLVSALALLVGQAFFAHAQTVLIDFGNDTTYRSLSVDNPDDNGNYWNSLQPGIFVENLVDIDNAATTIDVGWDTPVGFDSYNGPAGATDETTLETDVQFTDVDRVALGNLGGALEGPFDYICGPSLADNRVRFQIQQLDPSKRYNLTFFGSHSFSNDTVTEYTVYSDNTYTTPVATTSLEVQDPIMFWLHNRDEVATISNIAPQADNILYVGFVGAFGSLGYLNDMQIEAVAAPGVHGDFNADGKVDAADYVVWRKNETANNSLPNDNGLTTQTARFDLWRANFGEMTGGPGSGGSAAVPEPASMMLAIVAALGLLPFNRRR